MILNPAVIALVFGSLLLGAFAVYASVIGIRIMGSWDIQSGSETQIMLEKKTYLVSTIFTYLLGFEILSLLLFIHTADALHGLFVGAMCAAGSLNVNDYGYLTLLFKLLTFVGCGVWLIVNHIDNRAPDYPLIRPKYRLLLWLTGLLVTETILQTAYFSGLKANVLTSCCGTLFNEQARSIAGELASVPPNTAKAAFFLAAALTFRTGIHFLITGRAAGVFSASASVLLLVSVVSVISFISLYYYELPTHHCPFCLLQKEYHYIGYPLYIALFSGGIAGIAVGVIQRLSGPESLAEVIPLFQKRLCLTSLIAFGVFTLIAVYPMIFSDFVF